MVSTVLAISNGPTCGRMCRVMIRAWPDPIACARLTYTRSFRLMTWARMIRAVEVHSRMPITMITWNRLGPQRSAITTANTRSGMTSR